MLALVLFFVRVAPHFLYLNYFSRSYIIFRYKYTYILSVLFSNTSDLDNFIAIIIPFVSLNSLIMRYKNTPFAITKITFLDKFIYILLKTSNKMAKSPIFILFTIQLFTILPRKLVKSNKFGTFPIERI